MAVIHRSIRHHEAAPKHVALGDSGIEQRNRRSVGGAAERFSDEPRPVPGEPRRAQGAGQLISRDIVHTHLPGDAHRHDLAQPEVAHFVGPGAARGEGHEGGGASAADESQGGQKEEAAVYSASSLASFWISFLTPMTPGNATVTSTSSFKGLQATTTPIPNLAWRTRCPTLNGGVHEGARSWEAEGTTGLASRKLLKVPDRSGYGERADSGIA